MSSASRDRISAIYHLALERPAQERSAFLRARLYTISHRSEPAAWARSSARDGTLDRDVAITILPSHFTADPERRTRFAREARLLATLGHPNIGAIHGLEETDGVTALVLELVEGPTLADRLERGPLPISSRSDTRHYRAPEPKRTPRGSYQETCWRKSST